MRTLIVVLAVIAVVVSSAFAQTTIRVPADSPTIQGAINTAQNSDTVQVSPGTYFEHINFNGKAITVTSSDGPATTIIDAGGLAPVVTFKTSEGPTSVLSGFTLQNGNAAISGAGITIDHASPKILNNVIRNNRSVNGIGIYVYWGAPEIRGNTISDNRQANGTGGGGGGIYLLGSQAGTLVIGNRITNNSLLGGGDGGGIDCFGCVADISSNIIANNAVYNSGGGIATYNASTLRITQNVIANNTSQGGGAGGGVYVSSGTSVIITNNTIYGNIGTAGWIGTASGIFANGTPNTTLSNNIIIAPAGQAAVNCYSGTPPTFNNNDVYTPSGSAWAGNCVSSGGGNVSVEPLFVQATADDFHLLPISPAIDAGTNAAAALPTKDLDGKDRIFDGNFDGTATVDLGAYEFSGGPVSMAPATLAFDPVLVTTRSPAKATTIYNVSSQTVVVTSLTATAPFAASSACTSIPAHSTCVISVTFTPTSPGVTSGTLTVLTDAAVEPMTVALHGEGFDFALALSQGSVSLPRGGFASFSVNVGSVNAFAGTVDVNAAAPAGVTVTLSPSRVTAGGSAVMTVAVGATAALGNDPIQVQGTATGTQVTHAVPFTLTVIPGPLVSLFPATLDFGPQAIGTLRPPLPVTLTNIGAASLNISGIMASPYFTQSNNCPAQLAAAASCIVNVGFQPGLAQSIAGALTVFDDAGNSPQAAGLMGAGVYALTAVPASVQFPPTAVGQVNAPVTITVANALTEPVRIADMFASGGFVERTDCGVRLDAGATCAVQLQFAPHYTGSIVGALTILDGTTGTPLVVPLSGTAILPLTFSPASLNFGSQLRGTASGARDVTMTNSGNEALSTTRIFSSGLFSQTNNCPQIMSPGASCTISVTFTPISTGAVSGAVTVDSDAMAYADPGYRRQPRSRSLTPQMLTLTGTGVDALSLSSPELNFGEQPVGTISAAKTVVITNPVNGPAQNLTLSVYGNFTITSACGASLDQGLSCPVSVKFVPTSPGATSGSVVVQTNGVTQIINLTGKGT